MSLVSVVLGIIFIIIMVKAAPFISTMIFSKSDVEKCRASVSVKAISIEAGSFGTGLADPAQLGLDCHTRFLVAKKDGVYEGGKRAVDFGDRRFDEKRTEDKLKTVVADGMRDCWYMFGEGKINLFGSGDIHCVECYEIRFDDEVREEEENVLALNDFSGFLASNYISEKRDTTYAKYLDKTDIVPDEQYDLDTSRQYGVFYFRSAWKFADDAAKAAVVGTTVGGCVLGAKVGAIGGTFVGGPIGTVAGGFLGAGVGCVGGLAIGIMTAGEASEIDKAIGVAVMPIDEKLSKECGKLY